MVWEREVAPFICLFAHPKLHNLYNLFDSLAKAKYMKFSLLNDFVIYM